MTKAEEVLLRGCVRLEVQLVEIFGEQDDSVHLVRRIQDDVSVSDVDLELLRERLRAVAEMLDLPPPVGHGGQEHRGQLERLLRLAPAGWFRFERRVSKEDVGEVGASDQVWVVHGMAPLATPDLAWVYSETIRSERLS